MSKKKNITTEDLSKFFPDYTITLDGEPDFSITEDVEKHTIDIGKKGKKGKIDNDRKSVNINKITLDKVPDNTKNTIKSDESGTLGDIRKNLNDSIKTLHDMTNRIKDSFKDEDAAKDSTSPFLPLDISPDPDAKFDDFDFDDDFMYDSPIPYICGVTHSMRFNVLDGYTLTPERMNNIINELPNDIVIMSIDIDPDDDTVSIDFDLRD